MLPHALEVICGKVSDEMDVVQEAEKLPGLGSISKSSDAIVLEFQNLNCLQPFQRRKNYSETFRIQ